MWVYEKSLKFCGKVTQWQWWCYDFTITSTLYWKFQRFFIGAHWLRKFWKKFMNIYSKKIHFCEFFQDFRSWCNTLGKNKSEKKCFWVRKRKLAPKILKKITEVYFFTIIDHEFFQILLSNRGLCRKYFPIIAFFPMLFKWGKRGVASSGKKFFSGGLMNISCIWMFSRIHIWAWTWKKKFIGK